MPKGREEQYDENKDPTLDTEQMKAAIEAVFQKMGADRDEAVRAPRKADYKKPEVELLKNKKKLY